MSVTPSLRVACAVEGESYVRHCAAMLYSLLARHPDSALKIDYLYGEDTSARGRRRLQSMVTQLGGDIAFHRIPEGWIAGLPVEGFTGKASWYRIFLPELLPEADRVLYLDCDLLVLDSLLPMWSLPLGNCLVGAVTNVLPTGDLLHADDLGLPGRDSYFNSGVLLMNLELMRCEGISERLRTVSLDNASGLRWRDQDALNLLLHDRRLPLPPRWNCTNAMMKRKWAGRYFDPAGLEEAHRVPAIRHFEGPAENKPWHLLGNPELRRLYVQQRRHTPWPRVGFTGCTPANVVRYTCDQFRDRRSPE